MRQKTAVLLIVFLVAVSTPWVVAQELPAKAFRNVILHTADGDDIEGASIVWRDGVIEAVGKGIQIPFDAQVIDGGDSLHIYPGFVDGYSLWGSPELPEKFEEPERPGEPGYERAGIQPQRMLHDDLLVSDSKALKEAQTYGFTTAALGFKGFMLPGQLDLYFLNGVSTGEYLYKKSVALQAQLEKAPGGWGNGAYPTTKIGVMAKLRQLFYDAEALDQHMTYYADNQSDMPPYKHDEVLEALIPVKNNQQTMFWKVDEQEMIERVLWLKEELGFYMVLVGGEEAYQMKDELKSRAVPVLATFELPQKPDWKKSKEDKNDSVQTDIAEISEAEQQFRDKQWKAYQEELNNIKSLLDAGVKVGFASAGQSPEEIRKQFKPLLETGVMEDQLLRILTKNTAEILDLEKVIGDLDTGHIASFSVYTRPFTDKKAKVRYSVSGGELTDYELEMNEDKQDD